MSDFVAQFITILADILYVALVGRVLLSWINIGQSSPFYPIVTIIYQITEPILGPIRRLLPRFGMLDLSPIVAILLISLVQRVLVGLAG